MELRNWLLVFHVAAAFVWVGGSILFQVLGLRAARIADPARMADGARTLAFAVPNVVTPAALVTLAAGIGLVLEREAFEFTMFWIVFALVVVLGTLAMLFGYYLPEARRAIATFDRQGPSPQLAATWRRVAILTRVNSIALIAVIWVMVFKPGA